MKIKVTPVLAFTEQSFNACYAVAVQAGSMEHQVKILGLFEEKRLALEFIAKCNTLGAYLWHVDGKDGEQ